MDAEPTGRLYHCARPECHAQVLICPPCSLCCDWRLELEWHARCQGLPLVDSKELDLRHARKAASIDGVFKFLEVDAMRGGGGDDR